MCSTSLGLAVVPGREVEKQPVRGHRHHAGPKRRVSVAGVGVAQPAVDRLAGKYQAPSRRRRGRRTHSRYRT